MFKKSRMRQKFFGEKSALHFLSSPDKLPVMKINLLMARKVSRATRLRRRAI
jgi:hypothetical protein